MDETAPDTAPAAVETPAGAALEKILDTNGLDESDDGSLILPNLAQGHSN